MGIPKLSTVEFNSLHDFFNATNGPFWRWHNVSVRSTPWNFSIPGVNPCFDDWQGLHCSCGLTSCSVQLLFLDHHNLTGHLPDSMENFSQMAQLILRGNNITGTITRSIGNLTDLKMLDLSSNKFSGEIPSSIGQLSNLQTLNLASNRLTRIPEEFYDLRGLKALSLFDNRITGYISTGIGNLIALETLQLQINLFAPQTLPQEICELRSLMSIDISRIQLVGPFPECLFGMKNLKSFSCEGNNLGCLLSDGFGNLTNLVSLDFAYSDLFGTIPPSLGNLSNIEALTFSGNFLTGPIPRSFENLLNLRELSVQLNGLYGKIDFLAKLNITLFYFHNNLFTGHFEVPEEGLVDIVYLDVSMNLLSGPIPFNKHWGRIEVYEVYHNYFSSSLPCFTNISQMLFMTTISNYLTSTIPSDLLAHTQLLYDVGLSENLLTGTIPQTLTQFPLLNQLLLANNFLTGLLPNLQNSTFLVVLDVSYNQLHGRPADSLRHIEFLEQLFLEDNLFTGAIHELVNITLQKQLVNIDSSANEFTGTIPREIFLDAHKLTTFAASSNCLDGDIPSEICESHSLVSLSLDGLTTSSKCKNLFFPGLPYLSGFAASHFVKGPIPSCLYEMPLLELLHLSGNGLTGTIPNVNFSSSLTNLVLSHNALMGTIPEAIQLRQWLSLDLSYNKLSGTLSPIFEIPPYNSSTSLEVNRLSGRIPSSLIHSTTDINVLSGNIFTCNMIGSDLPKNDPDTKSYSCGSDNVNNVLYLWIGVVFSVPLIVLFFARFFSKTLLSLRGMFSEVCEKCVVWRNALRENDNRVNLTRLSIYFSEVRQGTRKLTAYCILILLPLYSALKVYSSSYSIQYAWSVSAVLMNGQTAAIVLLLTFMVFAVFYLSVLKEVVRKLNIRMPKDKSRRSLPLIPVRVLLSTERVFVYSLVILFDLVLMLSADFSYVFVVISYDTLVATLAALTLALFRFATNHVILWHSLLRTTKLLNWMRMKYFKTTDNKSLIAELEFSASDISFLENLTLFNNIIIPGIAIVFILPDCFYNVLFSANDIISYYNYEDCYEHAPVRGSSHRCFEHSGIDSYSPPFLYSFQCSSKIIINYVPVYVLMFLIATVIPFMKITSELVYQALKGQKDAQNNRFSGIIQLFLPGYFRDFRVEGSRVSNIPSEEVVSKRSSSIGEEENTKKRLFSKLTITVQINSYLTILMCFGALFPPLALIASIAIFSITYFEELCIWVLTETRRLGAGYEWYEEQIERECEGVEESSSLTIWSTLVVSCCLYGYMIFDTMGDSTGGEGALPMTLMMLLMPLFCYGGLRLYRRWKTSDSEGTIAQCEVTVEGKEGMEGSKEIFGGESSTDLKRVEVSSRRFGALVDIELSTNESFSSHLPSTDYTRDLSIVNNPIRQRI